ncbi:RsmG family class I SAM-dependent methyltransferase [Deinococcus peraridilitoris]|uniref:Ribosomal RNA small subunit methyltransferase G n=1 Tax=Deinococcus peraridilitoris (strain DSM 19664 / LMG 22246 / CIP 109416 / KR-200) TaxID=937777 RepID=L0A352_DEIPD|nr:RsmG family class I SAM-dependent methyltransferase [Deinococcus peraridilitoris]AFZ67440.1 putative S-adenosylmethionine-dependent methyltransferase involved in bacterial cell division [Deinococcus peraridilitoris DSM 19664]
MKQSYSDLVRTYAGTLDLFGPQVLSEWATHEATAQRYADELPSGTTLLDLGTGGGLPGMVIAESRPDVTVILCERRARRAAFLKLAVAKLGFRNAHVFARDVRQYQQPVEWIAAQAVGELPILLELVRHIVPARWFLLTRRPRTWYAPQELMGFRITARREPLDEQHDLVILTFTAKEAAS